MSDAHENSAYEISDARVPQVLAGVAILLGGIVFSLVVAAFVCRGGLMLPVQNSVNMSFKHGSENDSSIVRDWREQDKAVREHLESYWWVDREKGAVSIPIERAMELIARDAENLARKKP